MAEKQRNWSLIIGLAIPPAMIVFVAMAIYLPRVFVSVDPPQYDFLFMTGNAYQVAYYVRDGHLVEEQSGTTPAPAMPPDVRFFVYNVAGDKLQEMSFEEASRISLDSSMIAPDGYRVEQGRHRGWFLFDFSYGVPRWFLVKNGHSHKLEAISDPEAPYHYYYLRFLGWVRQ